MPEWRGFSHSRKEPPNTPGWSALDPLGAGGGGRSAVNFAKTAPLRGQEKPAGAGTPLPLPSARCLFKRRAAATPQHVSEGKRCLPSVSIPPRGPSPSAPPAAQEHPGEAAAWPRKQVAELAGCLLQWFCAPREELPRRSGGPR
ncbi:unnamed protein product [Lepidochelys olivacea]